MKFSKKEQVQGKFAKKGVEIRDGETITIKSEGKPVEGQFGTQNIFEITTHSGDFLMSFNQTSINSLVDEWGDESTNWVGKKVKIHAIKQNVAGKFISVYYVAPEGYEMGENGFEKEGSQGNSTDEIPVIQVEEDANVPF